MTLRLRAAMRQRLDQRERGAATLEAVGMYAVAAVLTVAVILAALASAPVINEKFRQAICMVTTLGHGPCESLVTSAADHKPTEPCVVSASGHTGSVELSLVVTVGESERLLVEKLNNGKYRVTRGVGGKVGAGVGVGANISATWADKTVGAAAVADASVAATFSGGQTYYADNPDEVQNLIWAHSESVAKDNVFGGSGLVRWAVDGATELLGVGHNLPVPNEVYGEGGVSADAKAQATLLIANAHAGVGVQGVLGIREGADGTSTTYYKASLDGNVSAGTWAGDEETDQTAYSKAGLEGAAEAIVEVERDAKGNITAVRVKSVLSGTAEARKKGGSVDDGPSPRQAYIENVVELPIHSANDQVIAQRYLNAMRIGSLGGFPDIPKSAQNYLPIANPLDALGATKGFAQAASLRGFVTEQTFNDDPSSYDVTLDAKPLVKVGGGVKVDTVNRVAKGAKYWDGSTWATWAGCGGK